MRRIFLPIFLACTLSAAAAQESAPTPVPEKATGCYMDLLAMRTAGGKHIYRIGNTLRLLLQRNEGGEWITNVWYSIEPVVGGRVRGATRRCSVQIPMSAGMVDKANNFARGLRKKQIEAEGEKDDDNDGEADD